MLSFSDTHDWPGRYLVDHPNSGKAVRRIVAGMVSVGTLALAAPAAAVSTDPGGIGQYVFKPNPGGIGQYHPRHGGSAKAI